MKSFKVLGTMLLAAVIAQPVFAQIREAKPAEAKKIEKNAGKGVNGTTGAVIDISTVRRQQQERLGQTAPTAPVAIDAKKDVKKVEAKKEVVNVKVSPEIVKLIPVEMQDFYLLTGANGEKTMRASYKEQGTQQLSAEKLRATLNELKAKPGAVEFVTAFSKELVKGDQGPSPQKRYLVEVIAQLVAKTGVPADMDAQMLSDAYVSLAAKKSIGARGFIEIYEQAVLIATNHRGPSLGFREFVDQGLDAWARTNNKSEKTVKSIKDQCCLGYCIAKAA